MTKIRRGDLSRNNSALLNTKCKNTWPGKIWKNYLNPFQEPAVIDHHGHFPPHRDESNFLRLVEALVADIVRDGLALLVVADKDFVQASLLRELSARVDQLHPNGGHASGTAPVAGGDFGGESRRTHGGAGRAQLAFG